MLHHVFGGERLVGEAHVHHRRRVSLGRREVDQPPLPQHVDAPSALERELLDERTHRSAAARHRSQRLEVDLHVEVAGVAEDGAVLQLAEVVTGHDRRVAGHRDEHVADRGGLGHRHHLEAIHDRLERAHRLDLGDDDVGAQALGARRDAAAAHAVAGDDHRAARQ